MEASTQSKRGNRRRVVLDIRVDQKEWLQSQVKEFSSMASVIRDLIDEAMFKDESFQTTCR